MNEEDKLICADCLKEFNKDSMIQLADKRYICETCLENYEVCENCSNYFPSEELTTVYGRRGEREWCESCREADTIQCNGCGDYYEADCIITDEEGISYCEGCQDEWRICESCGNWTSEWDNDYYCPSCSIDDDLIRDYLYKPSPHFHPDESDLYFGVELETDAYPNQSEAAEALYKLSTDEELFYMKEDGSLRNGIEIVTHPCSLEYHQFRFPWQKIVDTVREHEGVSHNGEHCGLHVHFSRGYFGSPGSREEELALLKFMFMFEKYWGNLVKFSRRTENQLSRWAAKYRDPETNGDPAFNPTNTPDGIDKVKKAKSYAGHGCATNLNGNYGATIEIRLFRGTLNLTSLLACIELTDFLARTAKTRSANSLYRMGWKQLVKSISQTKYPNLIEYLKRRELCV